MLNLEALENHIASFPEGYVFSYGLSEPFSWRGSYDEVAFAVTMDSMRREIVLDRIRSAYDRPFEGYKGGQYTYDKSTKVNFEESRSSWSDGGYAHKILINSLFR